MTKHRQYYIRKAHRYLGLFLGIQFLLWTAGGLYFSWNDIDEIHGDHQRKEPPALTMDMSLAAPDSVLDRLRLENGMTHLISFQLIPLLGKPIYQIQAVASHGKQKPTGQHGQTSYFLIDAVTGERKSPLKEAEAISVAQEQFNEKATIEEIKYITQVGKHHEYRNNPLPAYAVRFEHPSNTTVYVATELGTVQKFRNDKWRIFDFFWMLHTMDYEGRDHFGNTLLRACAFMGLITVISGFLLFAMTSRFIKK